MNQTGTLLVTTSRIPRAVIGDSRVEETVDLVRTCGMCVWWVGWVNETRRGLGVFSSLAFADLFDS